MTCAGTFTIVLPHIFKPAFVMAAAYCQQWHWDIVLSSGLQEQTQHHRELQLFVSLELNVAGIDLAVF